MFMCSFVCLRACAYVAVDLTGCGRGFFLAAARVCVCVCKSYPLMSAHVCMHAFVCVLFVFVCAGKENSCFVYQSECMCVHVCLCVCIHCALNLNFLRIVSHFCVYSHDWMRMRVCV